MAARRYVVLVVMTYAGAILWTALRVAVHRLTIPYPHMGPEVFFLFAPVLATPIAVLGVVFHLATSRRWCLRGYHDFALAGLSYSAVLLVLISPWLIFIVLLLHPWLWRFLSREPAPTS